MATIRDSVLHPVQLLDDDVVYMRAFDALRTKLGREPTSWDLEMSKNAELNANPVYIVTLAGSRLASLGDVGFANIEVAPNNEIVSISKDPAVKATTKEDHR